MYLRRKEDLYLEKWKKDESRKPLFIYGGHNVGKTCAVRRFAKENYENVIEIDFTAQKCFRVISEDGSSPADIIRNISRIDPSLGFVPQKTLIFFDGIEDHPEIMASLKFFRQDGRFDVICAGRLFPESYRRISSISVGCQSYYRMRSLDFEEFLWAMGYQEDFTEEIFAHMLRMEPLSPLYMSILSDLFFDFTLLGGLPEIVASYAQKKTFEDTLKMQRSILARYSADISRYAPDKEKDRIRSVLRAIVPFLSRENKKFQISKVAPGARSRAYYLCVEWLREAGLIDMCHQVRFPEQPLGGNFDPYKFKVYFTDTGLLVSQLGRADQERLRVHKDLGVCSGAVRENMAAEALRKSGCQIDYYKKQNSTLTEEFFMPTARSLIPVDVKAPGGMNKSLRTLIASAGYPDIRFGIRLTDGNISCRDHIYTFPYFCAFLLKRFVHEYSFPEEKDI